MDAGNFLLQSGAVSAFSLTVTRSKLLKPLREATGGWKREFLRCPYCVSHWFAGAITIVNRQSSIGNWAVYWMGMVAASAVISGVIIRLFLWNESHIEELESQLEEAASLLKEIV